MALLAALDDEYRAEAEYAAVLARFGPAPPFDRILESERLHVAALRHVLSTHGIAAPASAYDPAAFTPPDRLSAACEAAAAAEEASAALLERRLLAIVEAHDDVRTVLLRLHDASRYCHLLAFRLWADIHRREETEEVNEDGRS